MKINIDIYDAIKYSIDSLYEKEKINEDTIIIIPILKYFIKDILKIRDNYKNKLILVLYQSELINIQYDEKIECISIPDLMDEDEIFLMAKELKEEYSNAYLYNLETEKEYENYYSKILAKKIVVEYDNIYIPYYYGGLYKGLAKYFKLVYDSNIILINYRNKDLDENLDYDSIISFNDVIDDNNSLVISCKH